MAHDTKNRKPMSMADEEMALWRAWLIGDAASHLHGELQAG